MGTRAEVSSRAGESTLPITSQLATVIAVRHQTPEVVSSTPAERTMAQQPVEMILARQLVGYLSVPVILVDTTGVVVFYNEPAERMLGVRFEETGRIEREEADRLVELSDDPAAKPGDTGHPLEIALEERRPAHARRLMLRRSDRVRLQIEITAFPLIGQEGNLLGAVAMFWERPGP